MPSARCLRRSPPTRTCTRSSRSSCGPGRPVTCSRPSPRPTSASRSPSSCSTSQRRSALVDAKRGKVPAYAYPEAAARALSRAVRYAEWRAAPRPTVPAFPDVDAEPAKDIVAGLPGRAPGGGWLPRGDVSALLRSLPDTAGTGRRGQPVTGGTEVVDRRERRPDVRAARGVRARRGYRRGPRRPGRPARAADRGGRRHADQLDQVRAVAARSSRRARRRPRGAARRAAARLPARRRPPGNHRARPQPGHRHPRRRVVLDARIRVAPQVPQDPFLRRLR